MNKKLLFSLLIGLSLDANALTSVDVKVSDATVYAHVNAKAIGEYAWAIYNDTKVNQSYTVYANLCAESRGCQEVQNSYVAKPGQSIMNKFPIVFPVSFSRQGIYKLTAQIKIDGEHPSSMVKYGTVTVYPR